MKLKGLVAAVIMMISSISMGDVLLWSVTEDTPVYEREFEQNYLGELSPWLIETAPANGYGDLVARVYVRNSEGAVVRTLENRISGNDYDTYTHSIDATSLVRNPASGIDRAMSEALSGNNWNTDMLLDFYFQVQILEGTWNYNHDTLMYSPLLYSDNVSGRWLNEHHDYFSGGGVDVENLSPWIPERFYTVNPGLTDWTPPVIPEPNAALMMMIGLGMLMLRRRAGMGK